MASISRDANGTTRIQVIVAGKRRTIRLGTVPKKTAETVKLRVEMLAAAVATRTPIDAETAQWVGNVDDALAAKLAAADLVPKRDGVRAVGVREFCTNYVAGRPDVASNTRRNLLQATRYLVEFFGADRMVTAITAGDASRFAAHMRATFAPATANRTIVHAKQFFKAAERDELIERSPFRDEKGGSMTNPDRMHFVTPEQTAALLDACPAGEWRLIVALARYGGLRTPSEHLALTWGDVDWERERFLVRSPKTGLRWVPLFPELRPHFDEAFARAEEGATHVVARTRDAGANWRTTFNKIVVRAGLLPWAKPFQNLRASRETELARTYPLHVVVSWIGNSVPVAAKHYLQVTDEDFERAVKGGARDGADCGADRSGREWTGRDESHASTTKPSVLSAPVPSGLVVSSCPVPREGVEPSGRVS